MPTPWKQHLPDPELRKVRKAAIDAGLATPANLDALLTGLPPAWVGTLPATPTPATRLLTVLGEMNTLFSLRNGDVPLVKWLDNAAALTSGRSESVIFETALDMITLTPSAPPPAAAATPAALVAGIESTTAAAASTLSGANTDVTPEALIFGIDGTLSVSYLNQALEATKAVCKMFVNRYFSGNVERENSGQPRVVSGTGWLIAPNLVITNHHVIKARRTGLFGEPDPSDSDFKLQGDNARVVFDYFADPEPGDLLPVTLQAADQDLDFAILRLGPDAAPRTPLPLRQFIVRKTLEQALGTGVNILQHPNGKPMRLGFRNNYVILGNDSVLTYVTDTDSGSSGSPVCDDSWNVAALHSGARSVTSENIMVNGAIIKRENYGTPIAAILAHLKEKHPSLYTEIVGTAQ